MGDLFDRQALIRILALPLVLIAAACDEGGASDDAVRFATLQEEIFTPKCTLASCHTASFHAGELVLEPEQAYAELVEGEVFQEAAAADGLELVVPGDAAASFLWMKVQTGLDARYGTMMPQGSAAGLPEDDVALIERWIEDGAAND